MGVECAHAPDQIGKCSSIAICAVLIRSVDMLVHFIGKRAGFETFAVLISSVGHACAADRQAELQPQQRRSAGGGAEQGQPQRAQHHQPTSQEQGPQRRLCLCWSHSLQSTFEHCQVRCEVPSGFDTMIGSTVSTCIDADLTDLV